MSDLARTIFETIRDEPYALRRATDDRPRNCFYKGLDLIEQLSKLGYGVRGRIGEMDWSKTPAPQSVLALLPNDILSTHFYIEVFRDGTWQLFDPSWEVSMGDKLGVPVSTWDGPNESGFAITKVYTLEEQTAYYEEKMGNPARVQEDLERLMPFFTAFNAWLDEVRSTL